MRPLWLVPLVACTAGPPDFDAYTLALSLEREADPLGMFMSAWGPGPGDAWVVGGQKGGDGFVLRGQPGAFAPVEVPADTPMLNWVHGTSDADVWVGGARGTVLHWDGAAWQDRSLDETGAVWGVHARASDDVLAVGGAFFGAGEAFLWRWDGAAWRALDLPEDLPASAPLFKAHAHDDGYLVVGAAGWALRVGPDDEVTRLDTGDLGEDLVTVHVAPGHDPVAVGGFVQGRLWTYDGQAFVHAGDAFSRLNGVHVLPNGVVVAVGNDGIAGTWDPATGAFTETERLTRDVWHGVWVGDDGTTLAVGGNFLTSQPTFEGVLGTGAGLP